MSSSNLGNTLQFLTLVGRLKHIKRTGWVLRGIDQPESVAGHMYRMAIMTFLVEESHQLKKSRCMELALVHDLAECIVGDITPFCGVSAEEKHRREKDAMLELSKLVGSSGSYLLQLFEEYESQSSEEAKFVKDLDRFDMVLQAFEYEKSANKPVDLQEFFDSVKGKLKHPMVTSLADELDKQRNNYLQSNKE
ncbi:5'-deoxynucleotidase HDDC2-like [Macrosteles quadrilineatus]|uniref:5'-deoxynucleotidase HDDC2-like n=1 Tax=Macrosteles quadrilineatus TaxID=74068 RepID=UPI0023E15EF5|nr:5'-deoxynucleotidase HDDC2-like [Macrosteles quadrilineatus]